MKFYLTIFMLAIIALKANAQSTNWLWAKSAGGLNSEFVQSVATDLMGNVYVTGYFNSPLLIFGTDTLINTTNGANCIFLTKYDASGNIIWAKSAGGGQYSSVAKGVATDVNGNVYITGSFGSPSIAFGTTILSNYEGSSIFLAKYDQAGNVLWAKNAIGFTYWATTFDYSNSVTTDLIGNVFITGYFGSNSLVFGNDTLHNGGTFIAKYDISGNVIWAKSGGGYDSKSIATDASGNAYITGKFGNISTFGTFTLTNTLSSLDIFLVKYSAAGNVVWAKSAIGSDDDNANSVTTDPYGNIYVTGEFESPTLTFGTTILTNTFSNGVETDIFIVKYDASGNVLWAKGAGGNRQDYSESITADGSSNVYITGNFGSPSITFGTITLTDANTGPVYITKYDAFGNAIWAMKSGDGVTSNANSYSVATDVTGNIYFTGYFGNPKVIFGVDTLINAGFYSADFFLVKLGVSTGVEKIEMENVFTIAPNPSLSKFTITFNEVQKNTSINIIDITGKEIKTLNFSGKDLTVGKGEMQKGIYFIQAIDEKKKFTCKKIIIQ